MEVTIDGRRSGTSPVGVGMGAAGGVTSARLPDKTFADGISGRRWRATAMEGRVEINLNLDQTGIPLSIATTKKA